MRDELRAAAADVIARSTDCVLDARSTVSVWDRAVTLARACLAEHPADDGEPIAPDRLPALGFVSATSSGRAWEIDPEHGEYRATLSMSYSDGGAWLFTGHGRGICISIANIRTLGELRACCRLLGVPLGEARP